MATRSRRPWAQGGLTADLIARAIIASAGTYGDDPVRAMLAKRGPVRRALIPAASAIHLETGVSLTRLSAMIGCTAGRRTRSGQAPGFAAAEAAARRAVAVALWRPEAAESVACSTTEPGPATSESPPGADAVRRFCAPELDEAMCGPTPSGPVAAKPSVKGAVTAADLAAFRRNRALAAFAPPVREPDRVFRASAMPAPPAATLGGRILTLLADGPACTMGMATVLDAKESAIVSAISVLEHEGRVVSDPMPAEGRRQQRWRLKVAAQA